MGKDASAEVRLSDAMPGTGPASVDPVANGARWPTTPRAGSITSTARKTSYFDRYPERRGNSPYVPSPKLVPPVRISPRPSDAEGHHSDLHLGRGRNKDDRSSTGRTTGEETPAEGQVTASSSSALTPLGRHKTSTKCSPSPERVIVVSEAHASPLRSSASPSTATGSSEMGPLEADIRSAMNKNTSIRLPKSERLSPAGSHGVWSDDGPGTGTADLMPGRQWLHRAADAREPQMSVRSRASSSSRTAKSEPRRRAVDGATERNAQAQQALYQYREKAARASAARQVKGLGPSLAGEEQNRWSPTQSPQGWTVEQDESHGRNLKAMSPQTLNALSDPLSPTAAKAQAHSPSTSATATGNLSADQGRPSRGDTLTSSAGRLAKAPDSAAKLAYPSQSSVPSISDIIGRHNQSVVHTHTSELASGSSPAHQYDSSDGESSCSVDSLGREVRDTLSIDSTLRKRRDTSPPAKQRTRRYAESSASLKQQQKSHVLKAPTFTSLKPKSANQLSSKISMPSLKGHSGSRHDSNVKKVAPGRLSDAGEAHEKNDHASPSLKPSPLAMTRSKSTYDLSNAQKGFKIDSNLAASFHRLEPARMSRSFSGTALPKASVPSTVDAYIQSARMTKVMTLTRPPFNGLRISLADIGDVKGHPVIVFLGLGAVRYLVGLYDEMAAALNLRLVCIDRWGLGKTDDLPSERRGVLQWSTVVQEVADRLGFNRFSLLAHSAGAPYAMATSLMLPERIAGPVHLLAPWVSSEIEGGYKWLRYVPDSLIRTAQAAEWRMQGWRLGLGKTATSTDGYSAQEDASSHHHQGHQQQQGHHKHEGMSTLPQEQSLDRLQGEQDRSTIADGSRSSPSRSSESGSLTQSVSVDGVSLSSANSFPANAVGGVRNVSLYPSPSSSSIETHDSMKQSRMSMERFSTSTLRHPSVANDETDIEGLEALRPLYAASVAPFFQSDKDSASKPSKEYFTQEKSSPHLPPPSTTVSGSTGPAADHYEDLVASLLRASHAECSRGGSTTDLLVILGRASQRPWGFTYADVKHPVRVWHGEKDDRVSVSSVLWMEREMSDCQLTLLKGAGHNLMTHPEAVIEALESIAAHRA